MVDGRKALYAEGRKKVNGFIVCTVTRNIRNSHSFFLFEKTKSFFKTIQIQKLNNFLDKKKPTKIIVVGHSCNTVDYKYFESLYESYSIVEWYFYYFDVLTKDNIEKLISLLGIKNVHVKHNDELKLDK